MSSNFNRLHVDILSPDMPTTNLRLDTRESLENSTYSADLENIQTTSTTPEEFTNSYEQEKQNHKPSIEDFKELETTFDKYGNIKTDKLGNPILKRKYASLPELWKAYAPTSADAYRSSDVYTQVKETVSFVSDIREYAKETKSEIHAFGYTEDGTFYVAMSEGNDQTKVQVMRFNPLNGIGTEEIISRNVELDNSYRRDQYQPPSREARVSFKHLEAVSEDDRLKPDYQRKATDIEIILSASGNYVVVDGRTQYLTRASDLDYVLNHIFPESTEDYNEKRRAELAALVREARLAASL